MRKRDDRRLSSFLSDLEGGPGRRRPPEPIRAELFGVERLEHHAESLASAQHIMARPPRGRQLTTRLKDNGVMLRDAYRKIGRAIREERTISPAAEWLIDNFHVAEEQIREVQNHLPAEYYDELPKLADPPFRGDPRVFALAWEFIAHTDSRFDLPMLCRFVNAYQRVQPLTIGELWAIPLTLRLVLVENLRRAGEGIASRLSNRQEADALVDGLLGLAGNGEAGEPVEATLKRFGRKPLPTSFAVQLAQRLRDPDPKVMPALVWLNERLAAEGTSIDEIVPQEHQAQGAVNVTVHNVITSMRLASAVDWTEFVESVSLVDAELRAGSDFAAMDFPSRNLYRRAIEELARRSRHSEIEIARRALSFRPARRQHAE